TILMVAIIFSFITVSKAGLQLQEKVFYAEYPPQRKYVMFACTLVLFVLSLASVTTSGFNPFIYFRF
ncbi:MAG: MBOAT family protein, partial [Bacteroidales bacterium]|nr:MBOAT family protein [Bacteroidales bacterium]